VFFNPVRSFIMATANTVKSAAQSVKAKVTQTARAAAQAVQPEAAKPLTAAERWSQSVRAATDNFMGEVEAPTWTRTLASIVIGMVAACAVYYYGATLLMPVIVGAVTALAGPGFITFLICVLGTLALFAGSFMAYGYVSSFVTSFDYAATKSAVMGWASKFKRNEVVSAA
jgi:hypothetical protein